VNHKNLSHRQSEDRFAAVLLSWLVAGSVAMAEPPAKPNELVPCPFSPAEIEEALGVAVGLGQMADMVFPEGRDVACTYPVRNSSTVIAVRQTIGVTVPAEASSGRPARTRPVANDPFGAVWDLALENGGNGNGNGPKVALKYQHRGADTTVLVYGGYFPEPDMRGKVLKLKKVP